MMNQSQSFEIAMRGFILYVAVILFLLFGVMPKASATVIDCDPNCSLDELEEHSVLINDKFFGNFAFEDPDAETPEPAEGEKVALDLSMIIFTPLNEDPLNPGFELDMSQVTGTPISASTPPEQNTLLFDVSTQSGLPLITDASLKVVFGETVDGVIEVILSIDDAIDETPLLVGGGGLEGGEVGEPTVTSSGPFEDEGDLISLQSNVAVDIDITRIPGLESTGVLQIDTLEVRVSQVPVPEPGTLLLLGSGMVGMGAAARRRNRRK